MLKPVSFVKTEDINPLRKAWEKTLTAPQDGMWESFRNAADHWKMVRAGKDIGYISANEEYGLLQFYVVPKWMTDRALLLEEFLRLHEIDKGMVGTNNPVFLSAALACKQSVEVHTFLFTDTLEPTVEEKNGLFRAAKVDELDRMIQFYQQALGAPEEWLRGYLGNHVNRGEVFFLEEDDTILGACEVRRSDSQPIVADIGMVVSPDFRRQGYGAFLLSKAKEVAKSWGREPICSCEKDNEGSLKAIQKNGFRSFDQVLAITF